MLRRELIHFVLTRYDDFAGVWALNIASLINVGLQIKTFANISIYRLYLVVLSIVIERSTVFLSWNLSYSRRSHNGFLFTSQKSRTRMARDVFDDDDDGGGDDEDLRSANVYVHASIA